MGCSRQKQATEGELLKVTIGPSFWPPGPSWRERPPSHIPTAICDATLPRLPCHSGLKFLETMTQKKSSVPEVVSCYKLRSLLQR